MHDISYHTCHYCMLSHRTADAFCHLVQPSGDLPPHMVKITSTVKASRVLVTMCQERAVLYEWMFGYHIDYLIVGDLWWLLIGCLQSICSSGSTTLMRMSVWMLYRQLLALLNDHWPMSLQIFSLPFVNARLIKRCLQLNMLPWFSWIFFS